MTTPVSNTLREPTGDECNANTLVCESPEQVGYAIWYPQMGGYCGKAVIVFTKGEKHPCFEAYVWHDGEFPFSGDRERTPVHIHHCVAEQFIEFGKTIQRLMGYGDDKNTDD